MWQGLSPNSRNEGDEHKLDISNWPHKSGRTGENTDLNIHKRVWNRELTHHPNSHPPVSIRKKARQTLNSWRGDILLPSHQPKDGVGKKKKSELDPNPTSVNLTQEF
ncbi:unnamed protein product [Pipistrellus nathusii]|uniref:Uncharacterized protein n=1 Tax=Pipistrellus nathusii TaxID=59473 RepID=A0ABN9ZD19_PIPNA